MHNKTSFRINKLKIDIHITKIIRAKWLLIGSNPHKVDNLPSNHVHSSNKSIINSGVEWEEGMSDI